MLERVLAADDYDCEGCFFHVTNAEKGELHCNKPAIPAYGEIDCVEYDVVDPRRLVYYIFKESCNEEQNETMAP